MMESKRPSRRVDVFPLAVIAAVLVGCPNTNFGSGGGTSSTTSTSSLGGNTSSTSGNPSTTGSTSTSATSNTSTSTSSTSSGGSIALGGQVHFLQSGTVTLANGADTVDVTANGDFTFPGKLAPGQAYAVTVSSSPVGQTCWVQNGAGNAQADVSNVDVRCTTILQSRTPTPGTGTATTSSATLVPISDINAINFSTDIATDVLATLLLPKVSTTSGSAFQVALELDGAVIGEADYSNGGDPIPAVVVQIQKVSPGVTHKLSAVWSCSQGTATEQSDVFTSEMNLIALGSLPSFDSDVAATLGATSGSTSIGNTQYTPVPLGFSPLSLSVSSPTQPALLMLMATDLVGDGSSARISLDGAGFAGTLEKMGAEVRSFTPLGLTTLAQGNHTLSADWYRFNTSSNMATRGTSGLSSSLGAVLFKSGTLSGSGVLNGTYQVNNPTTTFATVNPALGLTLTLPKPSKVLVTFQASDIRPDDTWPSIADVAIFVNGAQGPIIQTFDANNIDWVCQGYSMVGVVDAPMGIVTFDVRARDAFGSKYIQFDNMLNADVQRAILSAVVLD